MSRKIGNAEVNPIGFGAMGLAAFYTPKPVPQDQVDKVLERAISEGVNHWDTSDIYTDFSTGQLGDNERQIGSFFKSHPGSREKVFLATKFVFKVGASGFTLDGSKEWAQQAIDGSLERLGVKQVDLYYAHRPAPNAEVEETVGALKAIKDAGKTRFIGVSEYNLEQLERANKIAHIDAYQIEISPWTPEALTNGLVDWCEKNGTTIVAYSPLGRGFLTGSIKSPEDLDPSDFRHGNPRFQGDNFKKNLELVDDIKKIATKRGVQPSQVALAWVLAKNPNIVTIPGTTNPDRVAENNGANKVSLTADEVKELDDIINSFKVSGTRYEPNMAAAF